MRKNFKPLAMSFLAAAASIGIVVGGTFALFTDNASSSIELTAGKIELSLTTDNLVTYSVTPDSNGDREDENGAKYSSVATAVNGTFTNLGTASLVGNVLTLDRITPGDRVVFDATIGDTSNVSFLYRLKFQLVSVDTTLGAGIKTTTDISGTSTTYSGLKTFVSAWTLHTYDSTNPLSATINFDMELPITLGNAYQNKTAEYEITVEAVQGNASVSDESTVEVLMESFQDTQSAVASTPTVLSAANSDSSVSAQVTIPADTTEVPAGSEVTMVVSELELTTSTDSQTLNFDLAIYVDGVETTSFSSPIAVELYIGKYLEITQMKHNSTVMNPADYSYDASTGIVTFSTASFSPFSVTYAHMTRNTAYGFYDSYVDETNGYWVHEITTKAEFKNISAHITNKSTVSAADEFNGGTTPYPLANKTTVYLLNNDIDFGGEVWTEAESRALPIFSGHLKSNLSGNVVLSNATLVPYDNILDTDWYAAGLFNKVSDAYFENITLDDFHVNSGNGKGVGLFAAGLKQTITTENELVFTNCIVNASCSVVSSANTGAFVGSTRNITRVVFTNCINNADVQCGKTNIGAFVGTGTTVGAGSVNNLTFNNCVNNGDITGSDFVGGFTGNTGNGNRILSGTGNQNNGKVTVTSGTNYGFFFPGDSWYKTDSSSFAGTVSEKIYLATVPTAPNNYEYNHLSDFSYTLTDESHIAITATNYINYLMPSSVASLTLSFDDNNHLDIGDVDADTIIVNIRQHGLQLLANEYFVYGDNQETSEVGGPQQSEKHYFMHTQTFSSVSAAEQGIIKVTQCGYFQPDNALTIKCSYAAGFETFALSSSLKDESAYTNGYHISGDMAYIVANPDDSAEKYLGICDWRNEVLYEVTAKKNGAIVGLGSVCWGRSTGDSTLLQPITLN